MREPAGERQSSEGARNVSAALADPLVPDLDDHSGRTLPTDLLWLWRNVLGARRKRQGLLVFGLMLLGAVSELMTIGAFVPMIALFASTGAHQSGNRVSELLQRLGVSPGDYSLTTVALVFCVIAVATAITRIVLAWASQRYVFAIRHDVGVALYDRMLHQPYTFHVGINTSRIISSLESVPRLAAGMLMPMLQAGIAVVIGTFVLGGLIWLSPVASLIAVLGFGLIYGGLTLTAGRGLRRNAGVIARMSHQRFQTTQEGLGSIGDVLLDSAQPVYVRKFANIDRQLSNAQGANALVAVSPRFIAEAVGIVLITVLAVVLHKQQGGAAATLPVLGALALGAQRLLPLMQQSYFGWANLMSFRSQLFEIVILLQQPVPPKGQSEPLPPLRSSLELNHVGFAYSSAQHFALENVSLSIPKGARVGFVGKSGSGKTTLLNIVMGLLEPSSGEIRVDCQLIASSNKQSWQQQVAHVPQFIFLTDGSIAENIAFGKSANEIDADKLREVCRLAELGEFIDALPGGYATPVGERGVRLSGGQIQRIGLARALYKDATVLVLDEATSALDDATEANIIQAVQRLGRGYTVLMIAHRTTTLRECDIIYRLDSGTVVESGSPQEVLGSGVSAIKRGGGRHELPITPQSRCV